MYADQDEWTKRSILYTAGSGFFSSDRTIQQYADEIWDVKPVPRALRLIWHCCPIWRCAPGCPCEGWQPPPDLALPGWPLSPLGILICISNVSGHAPVVLGLGHAGSLCLCGPPVYCLERHGLAETHLHKLPEQGPKHCVSTVALHLVNLTSGISHARVGFTHGAPVISCGSAPGPE